MNIAFYLHDEQDAAACRGKLLKLKSRFRMVSCEEVRAFYAGKISLKNACCLTIDDGWLSTYRIVFPLLKELEIPAAVFVSPQACADGGCFWFQEIKTCDQDALKRMLVEKKLFRKEVMRFPLELIVKELPIDLVNDVLAEYRARRGLPVPARGVVSPAELREMAASGWVEIGAHTQTHPVLSKETAERSEREILESVGALKELLGAPVKSFAYPNGLPGTDFDRREIEAVKKSGVACAFSVRPGVLRTGSDVFSLPRVGSMKRIALGPLGLKLPSLHDQERPRRAIRELLRPQ